MSQSITFDEYCALIAAGLKRRAPLTRYQRTLARFDYDAGLAYTEALANRS